MAQVIDLDRYKADQIAQKAYKDWHRRFKETFSFDTCLSDLSDSTLLFLASPEDKSVNAFYELIVSVLESLSDNASPSSHAVHPKNDMDLMDIHLYLADRVRFEMMKRLSWLTSYPGEGVSIILLIRDYRQNKYESFTNPPILSPDHPGYKEYQSLIKRERELYVRKLFVPALLEFKKKR